MQNMSNKILVLLPTHRGISAETLDSLHNQTVPIKEICIASEVYPSHLPTWYRIVKSLNSVLPSVNLEDYDFLLRIDDDSYLPPNFIEENLKLNADVVGSSGYGQLIKTKAFIEIFNGLFPEVGTEDSYIYYMFMYRGLKVSGYKVRPKKIAKKSHNKSYWFNIGKERYKIGYLPHIVLLSFRDSISGFKVNFNVFYISVGYLASFVKRLEKYPFSSMVKRMQLEKLFKVIKRRI